MSIPTRQKVNRHNINNHLSLKESGIQKTIAILLGTLLSTSFANANGDHVQTDTTTGTIAEITGPRYYIESKDDRHE